MRNRLLAGRTATAGLAALLTLATLVAVRTPVAASGAERIPARSDNVVLLWNEAALQAVRDTRPAPTVTARALAVVHASIYDAWAAYDAKAVGSRLGGSLRQPPAERTPANKRTAISYAAYRALVNLFPARTDSFDALMAALGHDPADATTGTGPAGVGIRAAAAVLAHRADDGANQAGGTPTQSATSRSTPPTRSWTPTVGSRCGCRAARCRPSPPPTGIG
jgi:hypothetical protein